MTPGAACGDPIQRTLLRPKLAPLPREYPDIRLEFDINHAFRDIVADRFDAGVQLGDAIDKDMIALPIGAKLRRAVVAAPTYFAAHAKPGDPHERVKRNCINMRMQSGGGLHVLDFQCRDKQPNVRVDGQLTFNTSPNVVDAALAGLGIAWLPEEQFAPHIDEGRLSRVLEDWCPPFPGYHLHYPSRRQPSPAFSLELEVLRRCSCLARAVH